MNTMPGFGARSVPPCGDCYDDGHCSMNCGPAAPVVKTFFVDPPIPTGFEWFAFYEGDEPNEDGCQQTGYGRTEQAAIDNLLSEYPR